MLKHRFGRKNVAGVMGVIGKGKTVVVLRQLLRLGRVTLTQIKCRIRNTAVTSNFPDTPATEAGAPYRCQRRGRKLRNYHFKFPEKTSDIRHRDCHTGK
ncbi:hypothetical protein KQX54_015351 [Cotesia glomerata]|uniref:Uncharacterized protein n=1 Tax=Cotesia glomerata TaxID=32391 RepID=A0AAV7IW35_COTGL|nr:hypothetical protein KQX54_015351 [Cotesia glomerata]